VIATTDGGLRRHSVGAPPVLVSSSPPTCGTGVGEGNDSVSEITFANHSDGWVRGPGLYSTMDGAEMWRGAKTAGSVQALTVGGSEVWAAASECSDSGGGNNRSLELVRAPLSGGAWTKVAGLPTSSVSRDGTGATLEDPCVPAPGGQAPALAAIGESVWIACGGQAGVGSESKTIYTSVDGGRNWSAAGSSGQIGASPGPTPAAVPLGGYIQQPTLTSPSVGWLALSLGGLLVSRDSGHTWSAVIAANAVAGGSGVLALTFATPIAGWALAQAGGAAPNVIYLPHC
jgi:hypothetical protein